MGRVRRVAFVSHSVRLYGASRSLLALLEGLRAHDVQTMVILPGPGHMRDALAARGFAVAMAPFPGWVNESGARRDAPALGAAQARALSPLVDLLRSFRPDAVWSNACTTAVGALAAAALGLPHIWHLREVSGDGYPFHYIQGTAAAMALLRTAHARIAVSEALRSAYEAAGSGACDVIYNGVASARALAARAPAVPSGRRVRLLLPARIHPSKGQLTAIAATQVLRAAGHDVELHIVGDGELAACEAEIAQRSLGGAVTLAGFRADLDAEYRQASVVLNCSRYEGMGRTTIEAMTYGLPVVGNDDMGNAELIQHGVTGLLYDGSAAGMADAVGRLLREPEMARQIGARARRFAQRGFSNERCTQRALAILERVCSASDARSRGEAAGASAER